MSTDLARALFGRVVMVSKLSNLYSILCVYFCLVRALPLLTIGA